MRGAGNELEPLFRVIGVGLRVQHAKHLGGQFADMDGLAAAMSASAQNLRADVSGSSRERQPCAVTCPS